MDNREQENRGSANLLFQAASHRSADSVPGLLPTGAAVGGRAGAGRRGRFRDWHPKDARVACGWMNPADVNLYLVGFMGTGKTTIGRLVAQRLGFALLDSDQEIERQQGRSIAEIFAREGEAAFRAMEKQFVENGHPAERTVVACGGGLVVPPGMLELLKARGVVICLHASVEAILARTSKHRHRPLLNVENPEERIRALYAAREPVYRRAGTMLLTDSRSLTDIVAHVVRTWRREAAEFARQQA